MLVDQKGSCGLAPVDGERGHRVPDRVSRVHGAQIGLRDDVHVVQEERLAALEERLGFQKATAGLQGHLLLP